MIVTLKRTRFPSRHLEGQPTNSSRRLAKRNQFHIAKTQEAVACTVQRDIPNQLIEHCMNIPRKITMKMKAT